MIILNATKVVKSIIADNGKDMITIAPGGQSPLIIASRNTIMSAIKLGTSKEIGIILNGSYELDIAKNLSGAVPYLYTDIDEAKAKLIDSSIDYKSNLNSTKVNAQNEEIIKAKEKEITDLKAQISIYLANIESLKADGGLVKELERKIDTITADNKQAQLDRDRAKTQCQEYADKIEELTNKVNALTTDNENKTAEAKELHKMVNKLSKKIDAAEQVSVESAAKDEQIDSLKASLQEATNMIESMRNDFNTACSKFGISRTEDGEWIMNSDPNSDAEAVTAEVIE